MGIQRCSVWILSMLILVVVLPPGQVWAQTPGELDPSFGGDGKVTTDFNIGGYGDTAFGMALQPDGKILVVGVSNNNFAVVRYRTDGSLDPNFDGDGKVITDVGSYEIAYRVALQPDGKII